MQCSETEVFGVLGEVIVRVGLLSFLFSKFHGETGAGAVTTKQKNSAESSAVYTLIQV